MAGNLAHHSQEARVTDAAQRNLLLDHGEPRSRLVHQSIMARRVDGGYGECGAGHKRRNGVNGARTEKLHWSPIRLFGWAATARSAVEWTSVTMGTSRWGLGRLAPTVALAHSDAGLQPASRPRHAASRPGPSVSSSLTPFLRL